LAFSFARRRTLAAVADATEPGAIGRHLIKYQQFPKNN
jgi:hypothetical protein